MRQSRIGTEKDIIKAVAEKTGYSEETVADMYKAITLHFEAVTWDPTLTRVTLGRDLGSMYVKVPTLYELRYKGYDAPSKSLKDIEFEKICSQKMEVLKSRCHVRTSFHFKTPTIESSFLRERKTHEEVAKIQNDIYFETEKRKLN